MAIFTLLGLGALTLGGVAVGSFLKGSGGGRGMFESPYIGIGGTQTYQTKKEMQIIAPISAPISIISSQPTTTWEYSPITITESPFAGVTTKKEIAPQMRTDVAPLIAPQITASQAEGIGTGGAAPSIFEDLKPLILLGGGAVVLYYFFIKKKKKNN